ncbi:LPS translocon maturation chaperone LptM [Xylophilus sp.]|uniref:LPS translocon maturation chaperone LptM n=1 Tax=Xylophilus sp. TaxID=2653893 RepID=UPI0013B5EAD1|nr:MAG: hypothetical protein GAK38_01846 [Xylophilus sp.]
MCAGLLAGCGQKGPLYLPTDPVATGRASLPDTILPTRPAPSATDDSIPNTR